jgi:hypothetical protein
MYLPIWYRCKTDFSPKSGYQNRSRGSYTDFLTDLCNRSVEPKLFIGSAEIFPRKTQFSVFCSFLGHTVNAAKELFIDYDLLEFKN